jgi:hypothetical protein
LDLILENDDEHEEVKINMASFPFSIQEKIAMESNNSNDRLYTLRIHSEFFMGHRLEMKIVALKTFNRTISHGNTGKFGSHMKESNM